MSLYHANEFTVDLPADLTDKTVHIFSYTPPPAEGAPQGPGALSLVVARERPQRGEDVAAFTDRILEVMSRDLPVLTVIAREPTQLDGRPAVRVDYTWVSPQGRMFQRIVVAHAEAQDMMLVVTATCRDELDPRSAEVTRAFLSGFRFRT